MPSPKKSATQERVRFQVPTHLGSLDHYFRLIHARLEWEAGKLAKRPAKGGKRGRASTEECLNEIRGMLPDEQQMLVDAVSHHVLLFAERANAEAGFDLLIKPQEMLIGGNRNWVFAFATMGAAAAVKLHRMTGVRQALAIRCIERNRPKRDYVKRPIENTDEMMLMDLLCAAVPSTCWELAPSPAMIIERFFDSFDMATLLEQQLTRRVDAITGLFLEEKLRSTARPSSARH